MTYNPTPAGLARDAAELSRVLAAALARLDELGQPAERHDEETTCGSCWRGTHSEVTARSQGFGTYVPQATSRTIRFMRTEADHTRVRSGPT